eukprot:CCRYP_021234-RA/>CCRYP_021234-RA protein AED:0.00 eAED:0.00 QI:40/1/1/1/0/0/2/76/34
MKNLLTSCPFPSCHPSLHCHKTQTREENSLLLLK